MVPKRVSIAGLMGLVGIVAFGLVALKQADPIWASAWFTFATLALTVGVFRAAFGRGRSRTFWAGFSLAGWLYLLVVYGGFYRTSPDRVDPPPLLTHYGIVRVQEIIQPESVFFAPTAIPPPAPIAVTGTLTGTNSGQAAPAPVAPMIFPPVATPTPPYFAFQARPAVRGPFLLASTVARTSFEQVGQSLWTLLIAWAGGFYAVRLASKRDAAMARDEAAVSPSSP